MIKTASLIPLAIALMVSGCITTGSAGDPAVTVTASVETVPVGTINADAADDPAIWRDQADPGKSLIVGTDKKAGLHVYDLAGRQLSFLAGFGLNNVDLTDLPDGRVLVAASDRSELATAHILLAVLNPQSGALTQLDRIPVGAGEGYGLCMGGATPDGGVTIYSAPKEGTIYATTLSFAGTALVHKTTILTTVPSQPEGCVFDGRSNTLYIGEEAAGIWAIDGATGTKTLVAQTGTGMLVADVEGLALAAEGEEGGYLIASSQGDNAYASYRLPDMAPMGRFRITDGAVGGTEETDGIALDTRSFGAAFPGGLFIAQDGVNPPAAQNFKFVRWDRIETALKAGITE